MAQASDFYSLSNWPGSFTKPLLIAGPCGVESREQVMTTAMGLKNSGAQILRGGIWKPRSRPGSFQGVGKEGLSWLKEAGVAAGMQVTVEVASPKHVEDALSAGIDILWIGARTTVNPFAVQEIADSLKGVNIPVMIKNPVNPDLELWIGAIERIYNTGIHCIAAIHRGFSTFEKTKYRNVPNWQIPIELKTRFRNLPVLCDPSHISGKRDLILEVAQTALDLDFDGLMIETHIDPDHALSDAQQQLKPVDYKKLLDQLIYRNTGAEDVVFRNKLEELREKIDQLDENILDLLSKRMAIARQIGEYKKQNDIKIFQVERWTQILYSRLQWGYEKELSEKFIRMMIEIIHEESMMQQNTVMNSKGKVEQSN